MMARRLGKNTGTVNYSTSLWILGSECQLRNACQGNCRCAHRTWLETDPQLATVEPGPAQANSCCPNGHHLRMRCGIELAPHRIAGLSDNLLVESDDSSDRNFACLGGECGEVQCAPHRGGKRKRRIHGNALAPAATIVMNGVSWRR
jgi:hypothetical protein